MILTMVRRVLEILRGDDREKDTALRSNATGDDEKNGEVDPFDPFPEPVIIEFRDVLDLHSIPPRQVKAVVLDYIEEAVSRKVRWVRIVHGKGSGVQRQIVRSILERNPMVAHFQDAPLEAGGWGATLVTFKDLKDLTR
jgi:dsDNA-specific endonuclease/ATPase MutS2